VSHTDDDRMSLSASFSTAVRLPRFAYTIGPLEPGFLTHGSPSAYPPDRSLTVLPSNIYFAWTKASADRFIADTTYGSIVGRSRDQDRGMPRRM